MGPVRFLRFGSAAVVGLLLAACGKSDTEMADTAVPAMSPGVMDTIIKTDTQLRGSTDSTTRAKLRIDTTRRDTTRDTVPH